MAPFPREHPQGLEDLVPGAWYYHDHYPRRVIQVGVRVSDGSPVSDVLFGVLYKSDGEGGWSPHEGLELENWDAQHMRYAWH